MIKPHEKKCQSDFCVTTNDMVKCRRRQVAKMIDFDYRQEYLKGVCQTKYYYGSAKKSTFSFSSNLQNDKKINNVKQYPRKKTDPNFDFSQALPCLVLMRF